MSLEKAESILQKYWGYDHFRSVQREVIASVLEKQDTLALMPTGGGKSICYQVPALMMQGVCIVVSPLISLMKDQCDGLKKRGLKAKALTSDQMPNGLEIALNSIETMRTKFVFVSPERLQNQIFISSEGAILVFLWSMRLTAFRNGDMISAPNTDKSLF